MNVSSAALKPDIGRGERSVVTSGHWLRQVLREFRSGLTPRRVVSGLLILAASTALTFGIYLFWDLLVAMGPWGYFGVFASELLSSATIFLPLPAHNYAMAMSITLDPYLLGLVGGVGAGLGELTGYLLGKAGKKVVSEGRWFARFQSLASKRFGLAIFVFAFMPAPIDFVGMLAGAAGYPVWRFIGVVCVGKVMKITLLTVAASYGLPVIIDFMS